MPALIVNEIFHSIQGESSRAGLPCVFVRLTSCNLRCSYCDTAYAFYEGIEMSVDSVMETVSAYGCRLVEVTGGEPLAQAGVYELMTRLCDEGYETMLETGGSLDMSRVDSRVKRIVDFKCPSSGMMKKNCWANVDLLTSTDEVKFVCGTREDFEWTCDTITRYDIHARCPVLVSPVFGVLPPLELAQWILESNINARLQLQMHKYIWQPETRGV